MITKQALEAYFAGLTVSEAIELTSFLAQLVVTKAEGDHIQKCLSSGKWLTTSPATQKLGLKPRQLRQLKNRNVLEAGKHYKVINPHSGRLTYLWHCDRIDTVLKKL